jgi:hypothetical protein
VLSATSEAKSSTTVLSALEPFKLVTTPVKVFKLPSKVVALVSKLPTLVFNLQLLQ